MAKAPASSFNLNLLLGQRSELLLSLSLLGLLVVLLVPLPPLLLDLLLTLNIALTILLLLVTLSAKQALDFSVFPSVLLLLTLFRLALNVATTRLILLKGHAGNVVQAFGEFVIGGNIVVGLVIFLILIVIQFVVITKGAGRVSEVAARFTLDAMPGKQMAIDAELNAGAIDETEARRRRQLLMREAEFYGTMDGASKFVRGDAIAAAIFTVINLVGGIVIGVIRGMPVTQAMQTYSTLTVGDGLVSQVPALIISTASGILVTKSTSETSLGDEIGGQFTSQPRPMQISGLIIAALGLAPGLPLLPFLLLGGALFFAGARMAPAGEEVEAGSPGPAKGAAAAAPGGPAPQPGRPGGEPFLDDFLQADRVCVEVGARLIPLVDPKRGGGLLDKIGQMRRDLARKNGVWVPPIRVRDNTQLESEGYRLLVNGREVARGHLRPDRWLAIDPGGVRAPVDGEDTLDPAFGLPAKWVADNDRQRAEFAGYTVVHAPDVLMTHLGEIVRRHAHELLGREDLKGLIDKVRETSPSLVDELVPLLTMGTLHRVLCLLLEEQVPINNLTRILESLASHLPALKDHPVELTERVRGDLGRTICDRFRDERGRIHAIVFDPLVEMELRKSVQDRTLVLEPTRLQNLVLRLANEWRKSSAKGQEVALLTDSSMRRMVRQTIARSLADLAVIAYQEIPGDMLLTVEATVTLADLGITRTEEPNPARAGTFAGR